MSSVVAVDAATKSSGSQRCLIGVAIVLNDVEAFREHYIEVVGDFYDEYNINRENDVIKSDHLSRNIPSYELGQARKSIGYDILDTESIDRINTTICWHEERVETPLGSFDGGQFVNRFVKSYFPVVTLWRYHRSQREYNPTEKAMLDSFTGKITKSWKYVGKTFDLDIIPKGDLTYPELSAADIIASALSGILPDDEPYTEYDRYVDGWLLNRLPNTDNQYVETDLIHHDSGEWMIDHLKPHKYDVRPHLSYPHPVVFIEESVLSGKDREAIDRSQLMGYLCNAARSMGGCVTKFDVETFPFTVRDGDYIVYNPVQPEKAKTLQNLHPSKDITLINAADVSEKI
nr:hypothetical protein [Haloarcula taiwanensis]